MNFCIFTMTIIVRSTKDKTAIDNFNENEWQEEKKDDDEEEQFKPIIYNNVMTYSQRQDRYNILTEKYPKMALAATETLTKEGFFYTSKVENKNLLYKIIILIYVHRNKRVWGKTNKTII